MLSLFLAALTPAEPPTFTQDVAPILFAHCAACHRPGQVGPFPLLTYADAARRRNLLAREAAAGRMPPWKPRPGHGEFRDARVLSAAQIDTLKRWADAGAPEGPPSALPRLPRFKAGWQLGKPDIVVEMGKPFPIPADGTDIYQHFVFPLSLDREVYVRGVEVLPGNRRVAHHAVGLLDGSGTARKLAVRGGGSYPGLGSPGFLPAGFTPGYVPGQTPRLFDADTAMTIKPGTDFVLQMHYHPTGRREIDRTKVGLYLTPQKPERNPCGVLMASEAIDIPAGVSDYRVTDAFTLPAPLEVRAVWPHMHLVGKSVRVWAEPPGAPAVPMLHIDDWDFNWQDTYHYAKPLALPRGTVIRSEWTYDNSAANPRNPNSPPKRVRHGERSTDEMAGLWVGGVARHWTDEIALWAAVVGHYFEIAGRK